MKSMYDPKGGKQMVASAKKDGGVNHSCNDETTISARQADPHSHALVLDPFVGRVAYVPDLGFRGRSTLRLVQSISTIPSAFPTTMNTCGRICVHKSGRFVIVSNRGHQSITVFKVKTKGSKRGELQNVGCYHTRGETPRHFQFDHSGQYLLVANQDTDSITVFNFNLSNGELKYSGNEYRVPSPNFVCCCPTHQEDDTIQSSSEILSESMVVSSSAVDAYDGSSCSDSEDSTVPVHRGQSSEQSLKEELAQAKLEIEALKKLLAEKV
eukprot:CAMPEP_0178852346 /NCGR_PEP_ID=MMETSP0746-20121128/21613_1 /TAXON_ID=913974 /ORGANISM="Nitzschia punctata, Strain CCMP561" /LENGTH=267 /DNA_ID=CAMNT_0020517985 /DNA_START=1 /DNA_END=804 /DNA_ORIENTATION=+